MDVDCGSARDRLGQTVGGRYVLHEVLGAGGTAVVYRASTAAGEEVAIKILHDHLSRSEEVCRRFVREGKLGNALDHPGVVRVLDHGKSEDGCPYLVLELLEGESLEQMRVRRGGRMPVGETLELCDQLLAVLEIAHAKSVVHRDIKPSNLFVTKLGHLKVLDFGIARLVDDTSSTATKTGTMIGTPAFMPPEQALSRPRDVDARTDLWAVGATLFTLISGEHVHIAESSSEHLVKAATLHARSLARALPGTPANVEAFVARCLSYDKAERWPSATAMREALADVRANPGRGIGTSTSPPPDRTRSSANIPTFVTGERGAYVSSIADERHSGDLDAGMAISSSPGFFSHGRGRRRWIVPMAAVAAALAAVLALVVVFTNRPLPPAQATGSIAPPVAPTVLVAPSTVPPAAAESVAAPPEPAASVRRPATTPHTQPVRPVVKKPVAPPAPSSRKDVYRPF